MKIYRKPSPRLVFGNAVKRGMSYVYGVERYVRCRIELKSYIRK